MCVCVERERAGGELGESGECYCRRAGRVREDPKSAFGVIWVGPESLPRRHVRS